MLLFENVYLQKNIGVCIAEKHCATVLADQAIKTNSRYINLAWTTVEPLLIIVALTYRQVYILMLFLRLILCFNR